MTSILYNWVLPTYSKQYKEPTLPTIQHDPENYLKICICWTRYIKVTCWHIFKISQQKIAEIINLRVPFVSFSLNKGTDKNGKVMCSTMLVLGFCEPGTEYLCLNLSHFVFHSFPLVSCFMTSSSRVGNTLLHYKVRLLDQVKFGFHLYCRSILSNQCSSIVIPYFRVSESLCSLGHLKPFFFPVSVVRLP